MTQDIQALRQLLVAEMAQRRVGVVQLRQGLAHIGVEADADEIAKNLSSGVVDKVFLIQCFEAIGAPTVHLNF